MFFSIVREVDKQASTTGKAVTANGAEWTFTYAFHTDMGLPKK